MKRLTISITPARLFVAALLFAAVALAAPLWGPISVPALFRSRVDVQGGLFVNAVDAGVYAVNGVALPAAASQDGGAATPLIQFGYGAGSGGVLAVTFTKAFTSIPQCQCTHVGTTNLNGCVLTTASPPTTTTASFSVTSGGTDIIDWLCTGDK